MYLMLTPDFSDPFVEVRMRVMFPSVPRVTEGERGVIFEKFGQSIFKQRPVVMRYRKSVSLNFFNYFKMKLAKEKNCLKILNKSKIKLTSNSFDRMNKVIAWPTTSKSGAITVWSDTENFNFQKDIFQTLSFKLETYVFRNLKFEYCYF